jgi:dihydrofolate reductase
MRRLVYYVATTVDGFIAHEDGSIEGFVAAGKHVTDYVKSLAAFDAVLMGRKTYEFGYRYGLKPGEPAYPGKMNYVIARSLEEFDHPEVRVIRDNVPAFVQSLKEQDGGAIYLCGGGQLAGFLLGHELIDELTLKVNPIVFGKGIRLFGGSIKQFNLSLNDTKVYSNGVMFHNYDIVYPGEA